VVLEIGGSILSCGVTSLSIFGHTKRVIIKPGTEQNRMESTGVHANFKLSIRTD